MRLTARLATTASLARHQRRALSDLWLGRDRIHDSFCFIGSNVFWAEGRWQSSAKLGPARKLQREACCLARRRSMIA
jgi:hypothetical protein